MLRASTAAAEQETLEAVEEVVGKEGALLVHALSEIPSGPGALSEHREVADLKSSRLTLQSKSDGAETVYCKSSCSASSGTRGGVPSR